MSNAVANQRTNQGRPTQRNQVLLNPSDDNLYLRFPYSPEIVRFINERLPDSRFIEGTVDSAIRTDGLPSPASAKPMLYGLKSRLANVPALQQLVRQYRFAGSQRAKQRLREMGRQYRQQTGQDSDTAGDGHLNVLGGTLADATERQNRIQVKTPRAPEITGITGRAPATARETTALKIQLPRPDDDNLLSGEAKPGIVKKDNGLHETITAYGGTHWVKGKKGQYRGYYKVVITYDTPKLIAQLKTKHNLRLSPELPKAIADRIGILTRDTKLSRASGADIRLPSPKGLEYLPYQKAGIAYAARKGNALIADEPGLGKTIQAVGVSNVCKSVRRVLVIVPASLKINWEREWQKWCIKGLSTGRVIGGKPESWPLNEKGQSPDVVVINYDVIEQHKKRLIEEPWDLMVVDEAHALKNDKTKRTRLILGHGKSHPGIPRHRLLLLTGTPILSRPNEIWTLANALDPDYFNNKIRFAIRYCNAHQGEHGWIMDGSSNLAELQRELRARIMVRRKKAHVLTELPPKTRQVIPLENDTIARKEQAAMNIARTSLQTIHQEWAQLDRTTPEGDTQAYKDAVQRLKGMEKIAFEELSRVRKETAIEKVPQVMQLVEQGLDSGKLILFAHHKEVVDAYQEALTQLFKKQAKRGTAPATVAVVSGKTPAGKRQAQADKFQNDPNCKVFVGSIGAAGVGLTLTEARLVIMAELDWVPGYVTQAEDRAHRIGQLYNVLVWHAVVDGSIDARMIRRLIEKQENLDEALDNESATPAPQTHYTDTPQIGASNEAELYEQLADYLEQQSTKAREGSGAIGQPNSAKDTTIPIAGQRTPAQPEDNPMNCMIEQDELAAYDRMIEAQGYG